MMIAFTSPNHSIYNLNLTKSFKTPHWKNIKKKSIKLLNHLNESKVLPLKVVIFLIEFLFMNTVFLISFFPDLVCFCLLNISFSTFTMSFCKCLIMSFSCSIGRN